MFWKSTLLYTASLLILSGCVGTSPTPNKETVIDSTLPVVELTRDGVYVDMEAIAFEWKSVSDPRVKGVYIYKSVPNKEEVAGVVFRDNHSSARAFVQTMDYPVTLFSAYG